MASLYQVLEIDYDTKTLFGNFKDLDGVRLWWTQDAELVSMNPEVYHFKFPTGTFNKMEVISRIDNQLLVWKCIDGHDEWKNTKIQFSITSMKNRSSQLHFKHFDW